MQKRAQPYDPSEFTGYGQGGLAGYGQGGYDVGLENVGLVPGMEPRIPEESRYQGLSSPWLLPVGLAASGLIGYGLLKRLGSRLAARKALATAAQPAATAATVSPLTAEQAALVKRWLPKKAHVVIQQLGVLTR